jgi:hypothetical protein
LRAVTAEADGGYIMFYIEHRGECVSTVEEIEAANWNDAKRKAISKMNVDDILAECEKDAIENDTRFNNFQSIVEDKCEHYATLSDYVPCEVNGDSEVEAEGAYCFNDGMDEYWLTAYDRAGNDYDFDAFIASYKNIKQGE